MDTLTQMDINYNREFLDVEFALIQAFLHQIDTDLLAVSFDYRDHEVQLRLFWQTQRDWYSFDEYVRGKMRPYEVTLDHHTLTKMAFNKYDFASRANFLFERAELL